MKMKPVKAVLGNPSFGELLEGALFPHPPEVTAAVFLFEDG